MKAVAVVVIEEMPEDCEDCPFVNSNNFCVLLDDYAFPNEWVEDAPYYSLKEKGSCPLKPMPEPRDVGYPIDDYAVGFSDGWDSCLKEITE